jgi:cell division protein FtsI/penicillin-binding protein 2
MLAAFGLTEAPQIRLEVAQPSSAPIPRDPAALQEAGVGQGDLLVSPLQLARAFGSLAGAGVRPGLSLAEAAGVEGLPWERLPPLEQSAQVMSPSVAQRSLEALGISAQGVVSYQALAYTGAQGEAVSWFLGARVVGGPRRVIVVVLEDGDLLRAAAIGQRGLEN